MPEPNSIDNREISARFVRQLPFAAQLFGREVQFSTPDGSKVHVQVDEKPNEAILMQAYRRWEGRKGVAGSAQEQRALYDSLHEKLADTRVLKEFVRAFLSLALGPRMLIFDKSKPFQTYPARCAAIDEAALTWYATNFAARDHERLLQPIACAGYARMPTRERSLYARNDLGIPTWGCALNVSDVCGLCPRHKRPGSKTIFNFYPLFAAEGFPELAYPEDSPE
jgi:hypothetical protein